MASFLESNCADPRSIPLLATTARNGAPSQGLFYVGAAGINPYADVVIAAAYPH